MSKVLLSQYKKDLSSGIMEPDKAQEQAVMLLQKLYDDIIQRDIKNKSLSGVISALWYKSFKPIKSLYLWGGVGRGKTYLMDMFYENLDIEKKLRSHFHRFMLKVHDQLASLEGHEDPLMIVADNFAKSYKVICFDEFYVSDIADAMVLGSLLKYLFERKVIIVFTSNVLVDNLYLDGLQRQRFMPAIGILKKNCNIFEVDSGIDYRLNILSEAGIYHLSSEIDVIDRIKDYFNKLIVVSPSWDTTMKVDGRSIDVYGIAGDIAWFSFASLCQTPRSSRDYIEIASCFHTIILSTIPVFNSDNEDEARRFIALIDELYDRCVNLIIVADFMPEELYHGDILKFQFKRTVSRLTDMRSDSYLSSPHAP